MGFVNEYISESDFEQHEIIELFKKYPGSNPPIEGTKAQWTLNADEDAFLLKLKDGREEDHRSSYWFLVVRSKLYFVQATSSYEGSTKLTDPNFIWIWNDICVREFPDGQPGKVSENILELIHQALKSYGYRGVMGPKVNTEIR